MFTADHERKHFFTLHRCLCCLSSTSFVEARSTEQQKETPGDMGWLCCKCGRYGDREGAQAVDATSKEVNWCVRQGTASMVGANTCCLCKRGAADFAFEAQACRNCMRQMGLTAQAQPSVQVPPSPTQSLVRWAAPRRKPGHAALERPHTAGNATHAARSVPAKASTATHVAVFDFDGVLFRTPAKPAWFPRKDYFAAMESLLPPNIPHEPSAEWWDATTLEAARSAMRDEQTWTVLITNRTVAFEVRTR